MPAARLVSLAFTLSLTVALALYAFIERSRIRVETIDIPTTKDVGPSGVLCIAQVSDVHIGSMNGRRRIEALLKRLRDHDPDVVVSTGDLIDSRAGLAVPVTEVLSALKPRLGKFAVIGNHECYAGLAPALAFMERCGFIVLRNRAVTVPGLRIVGVDDPVAGRPGESARNEVRVLRGLSSDGVFTVLLKHRPEVLPGGDPFRPATLRTHSQGPDLPPGLSDPPLLSGARRAFSSGARLLSLCESWDRDLGAAVSLACAARDHAPSRGTGAPRSWGAAGPGRISRSRRRGGGACAYGDGLQ